jgi:hypothetical protein
MRLPGRSAPFWRGTNAGEWPSTAGSKVICASQVSFAREREYEIGGVI